MNSENIERKVGHRRGRRAQSADPAMIDRYIDSGISRRDRYICQHAGVCANSLPATVAVAEDTLNINCSQATERQTRNTCPACPPGALFNHRGLIT